MERSVVGKRLELGGLAPWRRGRGEVEGGWRAYRLGLATDEEDDSEQRGRRGRSEQRGAGGGAVVAGRKSFRREPRHGR